MLISLVAVTLLTQTAGASAPVEAFCGDWDLGPGSTALRISPRDGNSIFVQYCNRDIFLSQHICRADVILSFSYFPDTDTFIHDDHGTQHLHATLQRDPNHPATIQYAFRSDVGVGTMTGKLISNATGTP